MPHDDLLIRNAIRARGVNASVEWSRQCAAARTITHPASTDQQLVQHLYQMYLLADFRTLDPKPILPSTNLTPHKQRLFPSLSSAGKHADEGGVILQILDIRDVGVSSLRMLEAVEAVEATRAAAADDPGNGPVAEKKYLPKSFLALDVTDGVRKAQAMVMSEIPGIAIDMQLGAKIRVQDVDTRHGILQLDPKNTTLLGGEVAELNEKPRIEAIMFKMQERLGLLPNAALVPRLPGANALQPLRARTPLATIQQPARTVAPTNNIWSNPQSAVIAADAIPTANTTLGSSHATVINNAPAPRIIRHDIPNPWRPVPPAQQPPSATLPSATPPPAYDEVDRQDRAQQQWEEEPQWDQFKDMDIEEDIGEWAVLSQLSVEELATSQPTNRQPRAPHQSLEETPQPRNRDWRNESPPLIATRSPAKKRILSLRAPRASPQPRRLDRPRGTWEVESLPLSARREKRSLSDSETEEGDLERGDMEVDPFADRPRSLSRSPVLDLDEDGWQKMDSIVDNDDLPPQVDYEQMLANIEDEDYKDDTSDWLFRRHTSPIIDDFVDNDYLPFEDDVFSFGALSQKRGAQAEEEDKKPEDGYTNRRRSQSFSLVPSKMEPMEVDSREETLIDVKSEILLALSGNSETMEENEDQKEEIKISHSRENSPAVKGPRNPAVILEKLADEELELEPVVVKSEVEVKSETKMDGEPEPVLVIKEVHAQVPEIESRSMEDVQHDSVIETETAVSEAEVEQRATPTRTTPEATPTRTTPEATPTCTTPEATPTSRTPEAPPAASTRSTVDTFGQRSGGSCYQEAIALSSDDEDDVTPDVHAKMSLQEEVKSLDVLRAVKIEPGLETASQVIPTLAQDNSVTMIKQEETLLEFDMDDMDDFGILKEVTVPEVEVNQVARMVQDGMEVKAKARVHKLGKFSLTTMSVSIPIILMPAVEPSLVGADVLKRLSTEESVNEMFEAVLDQDVIEIMFDISIAQFRRLVRDKESEAREAVTRLRTRFSEARTVECRFKGLRANLPVVRELKVLSKRPDSPSDISFSQASSI